MIRRLVPFALVGAAVLAGCGTDGEDSASTATESADRPVATETPIPEPTDGPADEPDRPADTDAPTESDLPPATEPPATDPPTTSETAPAATDAPTPEPAPLGGRLLPDAPTAESDIATNPVPDLVVDDVGRGVEVNVRNVFPAERPVLIWMWAPH